MSHAGVAVRGLVRRYGAHFALSGVDVEFPDGELTLLLGPNGAGKTTLIHALAGLVRPDAGEIRLGGDVFDRREPEHRGRVGLVAHDTLLYGPLTVRENLLFHARLHRVPTARVDRVIEDLGLSAQAGTPVTSLSHGYRKRTGLARALLHEPSLLLLDEPFTGLDPGGRGRVLDLLSGLARPGRTVVLATHAMEAALPVAGRVVVLVDGKVVHAELSGSVNRGALLAMLKGAVR